MNMILFSCLGFAITFTWIQLRFDWLALPYRNQPGLLPEDVLAPITHFHLYLRARVLLIAIMLLILLLIVLEIIQASVTSWVAWSSLILFIGGMVWAILIMIPTGKRLGKRIDSLEEQTRLAHSLLPMHLLAFGIILAVWLLQLYGTWR
jgi:hypothetical protein